MTLNGDIRLERPYYYCSACKHSQFPWDDILGLDGCVSPGLRPLVCLAGVLASFEEAADDVLRRFTGRRLSAATALRVTESNGARLQEQQQAGRMVSPCPAGPPWDFRQEGSDRSVAYLGLDAFSVPIQQPGGGAAEHRMLYTGRLYTPDKRHNLYLVDFELDRLVGSMRQAAIARGLSRADDVVAITDGGNGLEAALRRHFWDDLLCILDWYHAAEHLHTFAGVLYADHAGAAAVWAERSKGVLYEQGSAALLEILHSLQGPHLAASVAEELRKLIGYFADNRHRTHYPGYRVRGWDIGSGPTEAACKVIGERLKGSGMRWSEEGAVQVATLRALYESGPRYWDGFWSQTYKRAA